MGVTTPASRVIDDVLDKLNEDPADPRYWTRAEILDLIWEGAVELNLLAGYLQTEVTFNWGQNPIKPLDHATPSDPGTIAVLHARVGSNNAAMLKYSIEDLDQQFPTWENAEGTARDPGRWAPLGLNYILTNKPPSTTVAGEYDILTLPVYFTEDGIIPLDDEFVHCLNEYAFSVARLKEGGAEFQQAMGSYKEFNEVANDIAERSNWKRGPAWIIEPAAKLADAVPRRA